MDRCDVTGLAGWAFAPRDPERRLVLRVEFEQDTFQLVRADRYRADVQKAEHGHDGYCGFQVSGRRFCEQTPRRVTVDGDGCTVPFARRKATDGGRDRGPIRVGGMILHLDQQNGLTLTGSVMSAADPDTRRLLRLEASDGTVATTRACLYRPRSHVAFPDDHHGFAIVVPGGAGSFRLIDDEHDTVLHQSDRHANRPRR